jgi:hypothetical protein
MMFPVVSSDSNASRTSATGAGHKKAAPSYACSATVRPSLEMFVDSVARLKTCVEPAFADAAVAMCGNGLAALRATLMQPHR